MKVWSDGRDVVVTDDPKKIPYIMDRHYKVKGHTLRDAWKEVDLKERIHLDHPGLPSLYYTVDSLLRVSEGWIGTVVGCQPPYRGPNEK